MAIVNTFVIKVLSLHLVLLNHAPSSTQLHPPPPSSTQLHPAHFNLHLALCNTLNVIRTKISHVIGKSQSCLFCLKIGKHGTSRMLNFILILVFSISNPQTIFWANLGQKIQSSLFFTKIDTHGVSRMLMLSPTLVFGIPNPKFAFGQICSGKTKAVHFVCKLAHLVSWRC